MQRIVGRLAWKNLTLRAKVGLMIAGQAMLMLLIVLVARGGQAVVWQEIQTTFAAAIEMRALAQDLQLNLQSASQLESQLVRQQKGWDTFEYIKPRLQAEHNDLAEQLAADASRLESLGTSILEADKLAPVTNEVRTIQASTQTSRENYAAMLDLIGQIAQPETGAVAVLAERGDALEELTIEQANADLIRQVILMRNLEHTLAHSGSSADLEALLAAGDDYLAIYQSRVLLARRLPEIPRALEVYRAQAEQVAALWAQLETVYSASQLALDTGLAAASRLGTMTEAQHQFQLVRVETLQRSTNIVTLVGLILTFVLAGGLTSFLGRYVLRSVDHLLHVTRDFAAGNLDARATAAGADEIGQLSTNFNELADELQGLVDGLEQRVAERTRDLTITADLGRAVITQRDPRALMNEVVELIRERFGYYHAQIFLVDEAGEMANLVASTGAAGRSLLARRHALDVGSQSVIGQVTARGEPVVASDTSDSPVHRRNELLPDTRSEMALPMRIGDRVIGALDVQSVAPDVFDADVVAVFQIMADQLAIALDNARLQMALADSRAAIESMERRMTREAWDAYRRGRDPGAPLAYELRDTAIAPHATAAPAPMQRALRDGRVVIQENGEGDINLAVPIKVRGEVIGAFGFGGEAVGQLTEDDLSLAEAVADRVGVTLDNLRLVEQTARRAEHEQLLNEITAKIVGSTDVSYILQTTVRELGRVLRAPQTSVQLRPEDTDR